jgi:hypothetical protein
VVLEPLPAASGSQEQPINIEPSKPRTLRIQVRTTDVTAEALKSTEHIISANAPMINERPIEPRLANHEHRRREATTSRDPWRIKMAPAPLSDIDRRRHKILDGRFRVLEGKGAKISEAEKGLLCVTIDGEKIVFQVREKNRQVKVLQEDSRSSYRSQELVGTGKLVFAIRTYLRGPHNEEWGETHSNPLENRLPQIIVHGKSLAEWMAWAEAAADALDITRDGSEGLFSIIGGVKN